KAKKHLAELKLEAARQNLARLNDIIVELDRQLITLKRQAAKVQRYRRLSEQMRQYWRLIFSSEYRRIQKAIFDADAELGSTLSEEQSFIESLSALESRYKKVQAETRAIESRLDSVRSEVNNFEMEVDRTRNQISYMREQQQEISSRISDLERDL